jgi:hypothetical protein
MAAAAEVVDVAGDGVVMGRDAVLGDLECESVVHVGGHVFSVRQAEHHVKR